MTLLEVLGNVLNERVAPVRLPLELVHRATIDEYLTITDNLSNLNPLVQYRLTRHFNPTLYSIRVREYDDSQAVILTLNFSETRITAYGGPEGTAYPETVNEVLLLTQGALDDLYVDKEALWQPHS